MINGAQPRRFDCAQQAIGGCAQRRVRGLSTLLIRIDHHDRFNRFIGQQGRAKSIGHDDQRGELAIAYLFAAARRIVLGHLDRLYRFR